MPSEEYQKAEFEAAWIRNLTDKPLSKLEDSLFEDTKTINDQMMADLLNSLNDNLLGLASPHNNPLLCAMGNDLDEGLGLDLELDLDTNPIPPLLFEEEPPQEEEESAANILDIHSYSQKSHNELEIEQEKTSQVELVKKSLRVRKPKRHFEDSDSDWEEDEEEEENKSNNKKRRISSSSSYNSKKTKLYEMDAFDDPEMERCRQNAINAKINRDRKKQEKNSILSQVNKLKEENASLKSKADRMKRRAMDAETQLKRIQQMLRANNMENVLKNCSDIEE